jgi:preprotein translocase, YajC subunit
MSMLIMIVPIVAMIFFMQRSQKKQQQKRQDVLNSMTPGSRVVTIGGLHGVLSEVNESKNTVIVDCEGIFLEFDRAAIRTVKPGLVVDETTNETTEAVAETETVTETTTED